MFPVAPDSWTWTWTWTRTWTEAEEEEEGEHEEEGLAERKRERGGREAKYCYPSESGAQGCGGDPITTSSERLD